MPAFLGEDEKRNELSILLEHVDHMVRVMGEDSVGLGMDFDGMEDCRVTDLEEVSQLPNITRALVDRGYSEETIRKILGGNYMRVLAAVL